MAEQGSVKPLVEGSSPSLWIFLRNQEFSTVTRCSEYGYLSTCVTVR